MRMALPVGGGGPKTPSLSSSGSASRVSHDRQRALRVFLSTPNHCGSAAVPSSGSTLVIDGK